MRLKLLRITSTPDLVIPAEETVQETLARHALHVENPCGFGYFTGFPLSRE